MAYGILNVPSNSVAMEEGTVTLTNSETYPFNNSINTVALTQTHSGAHYIVSPEVTEAVGNIGDIAVTDVLENGFKIAFTGSASSVTVKYKVIGGYI